VRAPLTPRSLLTLVLLAVLAVFCARELRLESNVTRFMPDGRASELAALSGRLADSALTRTMVLSVRGPELDASLAAARALAERLAADEEVAWVRAGVDPGELEGIYELYFPRRHSFLSDEPEREIPELLSEAALAERARALRRELASPAAPFFKRLAAADPLGAFARVVERVRGDRTAMRVSGGRFVSIDGEHAIVLLATHASAFDHGRQAPLLARIERGVAELAREAGAELEVEMSGTNRFAADAQAAIRRDVQVVSGVAFVGVAIVFVTLVGSLRAFLVVFLPTLTGILVAVSTGVVFFGGFDGLTLAFGTVLIGVATDYSVHAFVHHGLARAGEPASTTVARLRGTLALGAVTTIASFVGLGFTSFPAFREIAVFSIVGLTASLATTLFVLPELLDRAPALPPRAVALVDRLGRFARGVGRPRRGHLALPLVCLALLPFALARIEWVDDLSRWTRIDPALRAEDARVRARVTRFDASRFVVVLADGLPAALDANATVHGRLEGLVREGELEDVRSLHSFLWSESLQRRNREVLLAQAPAERVPRVFAREGFRPEAFAPFREALASPPPAPLTLDDLRGSALDGVVSSMVVPLEGQVAVITYLRGVGSEAGVAAALEGVDGAHLFDQGAFLADVYGEFRATTVNQILIGSAIVAAILWLRYRRLRPAFAALAPSLLVAVVLIEAFAFLGVALNLLHVMTLIMVLGMGVDYGIFIVDGVRHRTGLGVTLLSLLVSCLTTFLVFGTLGLADQPVLRAIGATAGVGILLAFLFSPLALTVLGREAETAGGNARAPGGDAEAPGGA